MIPRVFGRGEIMNGLAGMDLEAELRVKWDSERVSEW